MKIPWYFVLLFLLKTNGKKAHLDENSFHHCFGNFFKSAILKFTWLQLCSKFLLKNYEKHWQKHFERHYTVEDFSNMDQDTWKIISCSRYLENYQLHKIRACTSKIGYISLTFICFFFSQAKLVFKFNPAVISILAVFFLFTFWLLIFCGSWSSSSASTPFFYKK